MSESKTFLYFMRATFYSHRQFIAWLTGSLLLILLLSGNLSLYHGFNFDFYDLGKSFALQAICTVFLYAGGMLMTLGAFKEVHDPKSNILYLTLPISPLMRYVGLWLLTGPLYLLFIMCIYELALLLHFSSLFYNMLSPYAYCPTVLDYLIINAICLFGSLKFKRAALIKTLLTMLVLSIFVHFLKESLTGPFTEKTALLKSIIWIIIGIAAWFAGFHQLRKCEV